MEVCEITARLNQSTKYHKTEHQAKHFRLAFFTAVSNEKKPQCHNVSQNIFWQYKACLDNLGHFFTLLHYLFIFF